MEPGIDLQITGKPLYYVKSGNNSSDHQSKISPGETETVQDRCGAMLIVTQKSSD